MAQGAGKCSRLPGSTTHLVSSLSSIAAGSCKRTCNRMFTSMWRRKFDVMRVWPWRLIWNDLFPPHCISSVAKAEWGRAGWACLTLCCSATMHRCCVAAKTWKSSVTGRENSRCLSSSVCSCQCCTSHVTRARNEQNIKHEAEDTLQIDTTEARCCVMLTLLNLSTVILYIKGQAVNSRWSFCRPVLLFLDWFNSVQAESSDPSLFSDWREFPHS